MAKNENSHMGEEYWSRRHNAITKKTINES